MASDGTFHMSVNPKEPRYVGRPSPEMDKAWEDLISRKFNNSFRRRERERERVHMLIIYIVRYVGLSDSEGIALADEAFWGRKLNNSYWAA